MRVAGAPEELSRQNNTIHTGMSNRQFKPNITENPRNLWWVPSAATQQDRSQYIQDSCNFIALKKTKKLLPNSRNTRKIPEIIKLILNFFLLEEQAYFTFKYHSSFMLVCGKFMLIYGRNQHNIVK